MAHEHGRLRAHQPGETIGGRYRVGGLLGQGGFGSVYSVDDTVLKVRMACKEMDLLQAPSGLRGDRASYLESFLREATALKTLHHPNIPPADYQLVPFGQWVCVSCGASDPAAEVCSACRTAAVRVDHRHYVLMRFVDGETLEARHATQGRPLLWDEAQTWFLQLASAVAELHRHGLLHRDIKPENVVIERDSGRAYLLDLGLVKAVDPAHLEGAGRGKTRVLSTKTQAIGTPGYAAPEMYGGASEPASDVFALGMVLYWALTDKNPGEEADRTEMLQQAPREFNEKIPPHVSDAIVKCIKSRPRDRFASVNDLVAAVNDPAPTPPVPRTKALRGSVPRTKALDSDPVPPASPRPLPPPPPQPSHAWMIGAVVGVVMFMGSIGLGVAAALGKLPWIAPPTPAPTTSPTPTLEVSESPPAPVDPAVAARFDARFAGEWAVSAAVGAATAPVAFVTVATDGACDVLKITPPMMAMPGAVGTLTEERGLIEAKGDRFVLTSTARQEGTYQFLDPGSVRIATNLGLFTWKRTRAAERMDPRLAGQWQPRFFAAEAQSEHESTPGFDQGPVPSGELKFYPQGAFTSTTLVMGTPVAQSGMLEAKDGRIQALGWNADGYSYHVDQARAMGRCRIDVTYQFLSPDALDIFTDQELGATKPDGTQGTSWKKIKVRYTRVDPKRGPPTAVEPILPLYDPAFLGLWDREGNTSGRATGNPRIDNAILPPSPGGMFIQVRQDGMCRFQRKSFERGEWEEWSYFLRTREDRWILFSGPAQASERGRYAVRPDGSIDIQVDGAAGREVWKRRR